MDADRPAEPDVASLFAPVAVEETFVGVLTEARQVLGGLDDPVDAELWGSDLIGALASSAAGQASLMTTLTGSLVPSPWTLKYSTTVWPAKGVMSKTTGIQSWALLTMVRMLASVAPVGLWISACC